MEIVDEYGSDALRLYLLSSQAVRAEQLKFSKSGVHDMMKDILIPLTNSIIFLKEYMCLYWNTYKSNPIFSIKMYMEKITNPINLWVLRKYNDLRNEFNNYMGGYDLKNAIGVLIKLVQILNNGYIKMGRNLIKGKESKEEWEQSLSVMNYIIGFILNDFKSVIPFFCESQYLSLKDFVIGKFGLLDNFDKSVHLVDGQDYLELTPEQVSKSTDFDIIYNIITQIYQLRSSNDISLKKPIKSVCLVWDIQLELRYSGRFKEYLGMVMDECNLLNIEILNKDQVNITKTITPVKALFFKAHGRDISESWEQISKMDIHALEQIIVNGEFNGFEIQSTWFNQKYSVNLVKSNKSDRDVVNDMVNDVVNDMVNDVVNDLVYREFDFGEFKDKIIILMDKSWSESNDKIYYYRLVATSIQKSRKNAGLHPWDSIVSLWDGNPKYRLDTDEAIEYIEKITRIKFLNYNNYDNNDDNTLKLSEQSKLPNYIYSNEFENIGIKIHLAK
jgi:isoleucyl-tRNA synthetase